MPERNSFDFLLLAATALLLLHPARAKTIDCQLVVSKFPEHSCNPFTPAFRDPEDHSVMFKINSIKEASDVQIVRILQTDKTESTAAFEKHTRIANRLPSSNVIAGLVHLEFSKLIVEACEFYQDLDPLITSIREEKEKPANPDTQEKDGKPGLPDIRPEVSLIKNLVELVINLNNAGYVYEGSFHDLDIKYIPSFKRLVWRDLSGAKRIDSPAVLPTSEPALADARYFDPQTPLKTLDTAVDAYRVGVILFKLFNKPEKFYQNPETPGAPFNFQEATYTISKGVNLEVAYVISRLLRADPEERLNLVSLLEFLKMAVENENPKVLEQDITIKAGGAFPVELAKGIEYAHLQRFGTDLQRDQSEKIKRGEQQGDTFLQGIAFWIFVVLVLVALGFVLMMYLGKPDGAQGGMPRPVLEDSDRHITDNTPRDASGNPIKKPLDP